MSEHVEVLRELRNRAEMDVRSAQGAAESARPIARADALDAAISALSVPDEAQPGWYCAHCQRGVDTREVTYSEQHEVCGRYIANDDPPPSAPEGVTHAARRVAAFLDHANLDTSVLPTGMGSALYALRDALAQQRATGAPMGFVEWFNGCGVWNRPPSQLARAAWEAALAQQPPAEAQPAAWATCNRDCDCVGDCKAGVERPVTPPTVPVGAAEDMVLDALHPPSAPAGDALRIAYRHLDMASMRVSHCKDAAAIEAALAQQPAAVDEAASLDTERVETIKRMRFGVAPVEGGGWDVYVYDADGGKETLISSAKDVRHAIDEAVAAQQGGRDDGRD